MQRVGDMQAVWYTGWNGCVDGVVYWLELMCRRCGLLVGIDV